MAAQSLKALRRIAFSVNALRAGLLHHERRRPKRPSTPPWMSLPCYYPHPYLFPHSAATRLPDRTTDHFGGRACNVTASVHPSIHPSRPTYPSSAALHKYYATS
ncbi:hypothetical protein A0H81_14050 [Grifola frondosa]|uniref:Uncharacterized protein n=1 Tax=Grifola frondosa TaxID=5627 RepID=A0A1C7LNR3_GRIFR|nr:hypothetical protein A0H81_14050 [Grifola frondosa]